MKRILFAFLLVLACWGCNEETRHIQVTYDQIENLRAGNPVVFEGRPIGRVTDIFYSTQNKYVIDLAIDMAFANAVTESAVLTIVDNPHVEGEMAIQVVNQDPGAPPLKEGAMVQGRSRETRDLGRIGDDIQGSIEDLKQGIAGFLDGLGDISTSEEFKRLQEELSRMGEEMKRSGKAVQEKVQEDILPRIRQELEQLRKKLEELGREEEVKPLEDKVDEMMGREI
jgi:gas vesicle protein